MFGKSKFTANGEPAPQGHAHFHYKMLLHRNDLSNISVICLLPRQPWLELHQRQHGNPGAITLIKLPGLEPRAADIPISIPSSAYLPGRLQNELFRESDFMPPAIKKHSLVTSLSPPGTWDCLCGYLGAVRGAMTSVKHSKHSDLEIYCCLYSGY